jgi:hypothetical protein
MVERMRAGEGDRVGLRGKLVVSTTVYINRS